MSGRVRVLVAGCALLALAGCGAGAGAGAEAPRPALQVAAPAPTAAGGPCLPYGISTPVAVVPDPALSGAAPGATSLPPRPTCTPAGTRPTLVPLPTPLWDLSVPAPASAPQNLSLSPWADTLDRVTAEAGAGSAATWHNAGGSYLTLQAAWGGGSRAVADILGASGPAAVAVSPGGRVHLAAAGLYAYSDDRGGSWSVPASAPDGDAPHLVVEHSGHVRLFWLHGGTLYTALQQGDGTWDAPAPLLANVVDYDALRAGEGVVAAATNGALTWVYRFPQPGPVATFGAADRVRLTYHRSEVLLGMGLGREGQGVAAAARSLDGGLGWSEVCNVQTSAYPVGDVALFPTEQGPYAVLWVWAQPGPSPNVGGFSFIALSMVRWGVGEACVTSHPGGYTPDQLAALGTGPGGLLRIDAPQTRFRLGMGGGVVALGFEGLADNLNPDVYLATVDPDAIFSGVSLGGVPEGTDDVQP